MEILGAHFGWPQILFLVWVLGNVGFAIANNGKPRPKNHQEYDASNSMLMALMLICLVSWGGFFSQ